MRVIAVEEHYRAPAVAAAIEAGLVPAPTNPAVTAILALLDDVGETRIADLDATGIDLQVLSLGPGHDDLPGEHALKLTRAANDYLGAAVDRYPDRFAGFASLPLARPEAAAEELTRAVRDLGLKGALINGHVRGRFLDAPEFRPVFAAAQELGVPIYLHPRQPPDPVRAAYYSGLDPVVAQNLAAGAWGWHVDTGLHVLRIVVSGVFDEFPDLMLIVGHMGEALPFMLARSSRILSGPARLAHPIDYYFTQNIYFTTSGLFSDPALRCLLSVVGADRVMFAVDYPYSTNAEGARFLREAQVTEPEREQIAHRTAEELLAL